MGPGMQLGWLVAVQLTFFRHSASENFSKAAFYIIVHNLSFNLGTRMKLEGCLYWLRYKEYIQIVSCDAVIVES